MCYWEATQLGVVQADWVEFAVFEVKFGGLIGGYELTRLNENFVNVVEFLLKGLMVTLHCSERWKFWVELSGGGYLVEVLSW